MRPVGFCQLLVVLTTSACNIVSPLVGVYEGIDKSNEAPPDFGSESDRNRWANTRLELRADGVCLWMHGFELPSLGRFTPFGWWRIDSSAGASQVITVQPEAQDPTVTRPFDVTTANGATVLVAQDGTRLVRTQLKRVTDLR